MSVATRKRALHCYCYVQPILMYGCEAKDNDEANRGKGDEVLERDVYTIDSKKDKQQDKQDRWSIEQETAGCLYG